MTFVKHLRLIIAGTAVALVAVAAPVQAKQPSDSTATVCNQATPHSLGGDLVATDPLTGSPAERYREDLNPHPGQGRGLVGAAEQSPALSLCGPDDVPTGTGGGVTYT